MVKRKKKYDTKSGENLKVNKSVEPTGTKTRVKSKATKKASVRRKRTNKKYDDFYRAIRKRINDWSKKKGKNYKYTEYLLAAPDLFHLLVRLFFDPRIPKKYKAKISVVLVYFVSPIDFIPEALTGPVGYIDDIALASYVLNEILRENEKIVREHWAGEKDILVTIAKITEAADNLVGSGVWSRIKNLLNERKGKSSKVRK